ncbi:MAG TPA: GNAT family N-acetyltransferase [Paracoccaceae bacterium]|nr:GNAT family N-acetyltransferase [Paracoccaceae bacterium]
MTLHKSGEPIEYVVTYLEMSQPPGYPYPPMSTGGPTSLLAADEPPVWYFLNLYDAVGQDYEWTDQHEMAPEDIRRILHDPNVTLFTLMRTGWPAGFFVLDARETGIVDIMYFGLVPEAMGQGLGRFLIETAIHTAWETPGTQKVTVNTNSLDHPRALPLYQRAGFVPVRRESKARILTRDWVGHDQGS